MCETMRIDVDDVQIWPIDEREEYATAPMNNHNQPSHIAPFRKLRDSDMVDTRNWETEQLYHDAMKDEAGHECGFCPVRVVFHLDPVERSGDK